jgi:hypothetical protein
MAVFLFAAMVQKTGSHPITKLGPELEKRFGARGFRCWLKIDDHLIEVQPPASLPQDRISRRRLAAAALEKYLELTKSETVVETAVLLAPKGGSLPEEAVNRTQDECFRDLASGAADIARTASVAAGSSATIADVAPGFQGVAVYVALADGARLGEKGSRAVAERVLAAHGGISYVHLARPDGPPIELGVDTAALASTTPGALK